MITKSKIVPKIIVKLTAFIPVSYNAQKNALILNPWKMSLKNETAHFTTKKG